MKKIIAYFSSALLLTLMPVHPAMGFEVVVEDNGGESSNEVSIDHSNETNVEQTNETESETDVSLDQSTGDNEASGNNGDVSVETGDTESSVEVSNESGTNATEVDACCSGEVNASIAGNGEGSDNSIDVNTHNQTDVTVTQTAMIRTSITGGASTGNNEASGNSGEVNMTTGDVKVNLSVKNRVNNAYIRVNNCCGLSGTAKINGNGSDSNNEIDVNNSNVVTVDKQDDANISNFIDFWGETGNNLLNDNLGDVALTTGDVTIGVALDTEANQEVVIIGGPKDDDDKPGNGDDEEDKPEEPKVPPKDDHKVGNGGNGNGGNGAAANGGNGQILGSQDGGQILPVTGTPNLLILLIANILMFLLGCYLRLRSGRAPATV